MPTRHQHARPRSAPAGVSRFQGPTVLFLALTLLLITGTTAQAGGNVTFLASALSGEHTYEISLPDGKSTLEWPLDLYLIGIDAKLCPDEHVQLELLALASPLENARQPLNDYDWYAAPRPSLEIYSETRVDARAIILAMQTRIFPITSEQVSCGLIAGYHFQEINSHGYNTLQAQNDPSRCFAALGPVIDYRATTSYIKTGLALQISPLDALVLNLDTAWLPLVRVRDNDNHMRRAKVLRGDCNGKGATIDFSASYRLHGPWHLRLQGSLTRIQAHGHQRQIWYADDPMSTTRDDTGDAVYGIPLDIDQESFSLGGGIGLNF